MRRLVLNLYGVSVKVCETSIWPSRFPVEWLLLTSVRSAGAADRGWPPERRELGSDVTTLPLLRKNPKKESTNLLVCVTHQLARFYLWPLTMKCPSLSSNNSHLKLDDY